MAREFSGSPDKNEGSIKVGQVVAEAQRLGLVLDESAAQRILGEMSVLSTGQKLTDEQLMEIVRKRIELRKIDKEKTAAFIEAFDLAHELYLKISINKQEGYYILDKNNPHGAMEMFRKLARKKGLVNETAYLHYLAERYRQILDKFGEPYSAAKKIFVVVGIGEAARVAAAYFRVHHSGEINAQYAVDIKKGVTDKNGKIGKDKSIYRGKTVDLDSIFLTREEAEASLNN